MQQPKISAGLLMYRLANGRPECFLVHPGGPYHKNKDAGDWSIPKGELEHPDAEHSDSELLAEAIREFSEETGTTPTSQRYLPLGQVRYKTGKTVHCWAFAGELTAPFQSNSCEIEWPPRSGKILEIPEVDRGEFFDLDTAKQKIYPAQVPFIERLEQLLKTAS